MRIVREPKVYVVGANILDEDALQEFLADEGASWRPDGRLNGESLAEAAGRVCYMSFSKPRPGGNRAYLRHILEVGHGSVLEHAVWSFLVTGISRALSHELVRHRAGVSPSQLSQRYVDESVAEYVEPDVIAGDVGLHALWLGAVEQSHAAYVRLAEALTEKLRLENTTPCHTCEGTGQLIGYDSCPHCKGSKRVPFGTVSATELRKQARQAARSVLPNATETKLFLTMNARAIRHFVELRASVHADVEIRKLAVAILRVMQAEAPALFGDYELHPLRDGTFEVKTPYRKV